MTASEFAFLALGLILGVATGAALIEVLRARPSAAREIRVTVAPNSIHARRASTLADGALVDGGPGPAVGGPGDRRWTDPDREVEGVTSPGRRLEDRRLDPAPHGDLVAPMRTAVLAAGARDRSTTPSMASASPTAASNPALPAPGPAPTAAALPPGPAPLWLSVASASGYGGGLVAVPMSMEPDPITQALRATAARVAVATMGGGAGRHALATEPRPDARNAAAPAGERDAATTGRTTAESDPRGSNADMPSASIDAPSAGGPATDAGPADGPPLDTGPCAEERRVADERCAVANRAREGAAQAAEALRVAQRTYDNHVGSAETAAAAIDPRSVRTAKEAAQSRFRDARGKAATRDDVEAAARAWLNEINQINQSTRDAGQRMERDRAAATALAPALERLAVEADAARISAESADEACMAAREAVVACDEARALEAAATAAAPRQAPDEDRIAAAMPAPADEFEPVEPMGSRAGEDAVLLRILRGEREAMLGAVARLGADDPEGQRRWQMWLSGLAEALIARSIEASSFDFPLDHFFWGPFSQTQNRDIAAGLSSLGYRFDGFGGWADERVPSQRDLSLAVGYAGLDPMRIRHWPTEPEMQELYAEVRVAADEYIAGAAGGLTLGEMVTLLGRRADALTELWNEWGTARPVLLGAG